ncbi:hypothetical protein [Cochlodiniinecator piscidefendens]|uniref:hypothetical protein n=1 Tax=Cochlodiniinecator piscidefendens TaxID=2715756 RepID=UPI00140BADF5|nr:hypothetical protein [Cochlodiniinecator piscidefendens]
MNNRRAMRAYLDEERALYQQLSQTHPRYAKFVERIELWLKRTRKAWRTLSDRDVAIPDTFLQPYQIDKTAFLPQGQGKGLLKKRSMLLNMVQIKYQLRGYNMMREYQRCVDFYPETLDPDRSYEILELSSGSCASVEVARHFGNTLQPTEFLEGRGSVYDPIHQAIDAKPINFNGAQTPYQFDDNSYDIVTCFQAIDAYGDEAQYAEFIGEMSRIAREKVVIVFNPSVESKFKGDVENSSDTLTRLLSNTFPGAEFNKCPSTGLLSMVWNTEEEEQRLTA